MKTTKLYKVFAVRKDGTLASFNRGHDTGTNPLIDKACFIYSPTKWNIAPTVEGIRTSFFCFKTEEACFKMLANTFSSERNFSIYEVEAKGISELKFYLQAFVADWELWKIKPKTGPDISVMDKYPDTILARQVKLIRKLTK